MDKSIIKRIEFLNGNIKTKNIFLSIIETRKRNERDYLNEIELNTGIPVISNSEIITEFYTDALIVENKEFLGEFFKSILPNISNSENSLLVLFNVENMYLYKRTMRFEASEMFKFINNRRNYNVSIIMFARKFEEFPKFIRENADIIIKNYEY